MPEALVLWNREDALQRVGNRPDRLRRIVSLFLRESQAYMATLNGAYENRDCQGFLPHIHTLKGVAANLSAESLHRMAEELECSAKAGDVSAIDAQWKAFLAIYKALTECLNTFLCDSEIEFPAESELLQKRMQDAYRALQRGDFLAPGELASLKAVLPAVISDEQYVQLEKHCHDFELAEARELLKVIAEQLSISLQ